LRDNKFVIPTYCEVIETRSLKNNASTTKSLIVCKTSER